MLEVLFVAFVCVVEPWSPAHAEPLANFYTYLVSMQSKLTDYSKDFIDYAKAGQSDLEYEIPSDMSAVANSTYTDITHEIDMYEIYARVDNNDKARIRSIIVDSVNGTVQRIDNNIDVINNGLSHAKREIVIESGSNLKRDLRDLRNHFLEFKDSIQN